jgi:uncharacterized membrane protein YuzA (DUF378 family)
LNKTHPLPIQSGFGEAKGGGDNMKMFHMIVITLVAVGALNWGMLGLFNFNLVEAIFGQMSGLTRIVYILVGASAVYFFAMHKKDCKICSGK